MRPDERFDMVVVGSGPAGEKAAAQAAYFGKRVAVVEHAPVAGGEMVSGAITTKAMREAALYLTGFTRHAVCGVSLDLDPQAVIDRLRSRAARVAAMMSEAVRENLRRHDIAFITGVARLGPGRTVMVDPGERWDVARPPGGRHSCRHRIVPAPPPDVPFTDPDVLDSEAALALDRPLESLVVVGGGPWPVSMRLSFWPSAQK